MLLLSLSAYAEKKCVIADSSQMESWEKSLLQSLEQYRKDKGIVLPEVDFDVEKTRVGYAFLVYDTLQSGGGIYAINLDNPQEYKLIGELTYKMTWASAFVKGKYYAYNVLGGGTNLPIGLYSIDLRTGRSTEIANYWETKGIPFLISMAYNPVTDEVIGLSDKPMHLVDCATGEILPLADVDRLFMTLAISKDGVIYAIDTQGMLCELDRQGTVREIGFTGWRLGGQQSMAFDPNDGKLYWALFGYKGEALFCEVDVKTGKATPLAELGHNSEWTGLYIPLREKNGKSLTDKK